MSKIVALRRLRKGTTIRDRGLWARNFNAALDRINVSPGEAFIVLSPDRLHDQKITRDGRCVYCDEPVLSTQDYQRVEGWERKRAGGGANQVTLRTTKPEWACRACIESAKRGTLNQDQLSAPMS